MSKPLSFVIYKNQLYNQNVDDILVIKKQSDIAYIIDTFLLYLTVNLRKHDSNNNSYSYIKNKNK